MKFHCRWLLSCAAVVLFALTIPVAKAAPYACEVTNVAGNVQFYLGESANDVSVIFDDGAATNDLGALAAGSNSFALGVHTNYAIVVSKAGTGAWGQISVDATNNSFYGPRGVGVNRNPGSSFFGRIYVVNGSAGTGTSPGRAVGRGVYVLNADTSDALGYGNTAQAPGMTIGASTTYSPYKPFVGPDNMVYVGNADGTAVSLSPPGNAIVWMLDPNLTSGTPVIQTNAVLGPAASCISTPFVTGSLATGNLQLYCNLWGYGATNTDLGIPLYTYIYSFGINGGPLPYTSAPSTNADVGGDALNNVDGILGDLYVAPDGKFFASQNRNASTGGAASGSVSIWEYASDAETYLWDSSSAAGGTDPFAADGGGSGGIYGIAVSPDDKYLAAVDYHTSDVLLCKLTNGIPDISTVTTNLTGMGASGVRSVAFDAADNVYVVSGTDDRLRVFSLGLTTTATTFNDLSGTNGTFSLSTPSATVSVVATTSQASQRGPTPGVFQITRAGGNTSLPLSVNFKFGGTATNGTYTVSPAGLVPAAANTITIAANVLSTNITITPVNDGLSRPTTTVVLSLSGSGNYSAVSPSSDTVYIQNTGPQYVFVSGVSAPSMYKAFSNDYASFTVTRWGDTSVAAYAVSGFTFSGTAVYGTDFSGTNLTTPSVTINPGDVTDTVFLSPLANGQLPVDTNVVAYTGNKTIVVGYTGTGGATNTATLTIIDNGNPPATYLYSDPLTNSDDATNWVTTSANDNMQVNAIDDYIDFAYDLFDDPRDPYVMNGFGAVPIPFPPSGAPTALRLTVNKSSAFGDGAAAAVNLYPTNAIFSGNYAVRFNMNLVEGYSSLYTTEGALFGINHTGVATNWFSGSAIRSGWGPDNNETWESDGIWCWVSVDDGIGTFAGGPSAYMTFTGIGGKLPNTGFASPLLAQADAASYANAFKSAVFTSSGGPGLAANTSPDNATGPSQYSSWADVELKQFNNIVTLSIDKTPIYEFTNTTSFTNGYLMLGYEDPYDSVGGGDAAVYYSNLRVVQLTPPLISETGLNSQSNKYVFDFTSTDGDATPASFTVVGSTVVNGTYTAVSGATITQLGNGAYQASVPVSGAIHFYRIQQKL